MSDFQDWVIKDMTVSILLCLKSLALEEGGALPWGQSSSTVEWYMWLLPNIKH